VTLVTPPFRKLFRGHVGTFPGSIHAKLEVRIAVLELLLAFNAQNFTGSRDSSHAPVREFFQSHVGTFHGSMHAKFEVHIFSRFETIGIYRPKN